MAKKYIVTLSEEERRQLSALCSKGKISARKLTHAAILLAADTSEHGPALTDQEIAAALGVSLSTVFRIRQRVVEHGIEAALERKESGRTYARRLDGVAEAHLVAIACSAPPDGRVRWTLRLLADRLVQLSIVETVSVETVRGTLKKTNSSRG